MSVLCETCQEYFQRRLREGWQCISLEGYKAVLLSPDGFRRELDLRNDVETLRPNAAGDEENIDYESPEDEDHYTLVDEASPDDSSTTVYTNNGSYQRDLYNLDNHQLANGTINSVTVFVRVYSSNEGAENHFKICLKSGGTVGESAEKKVSGDEWENHSNQWTVNPDDSEAFEEGDLDSLQAGISLKDDDGGYSHCTQVYVEVDYEGSSIFYQDTGDGAVTPTGDLGRNIFVGMGQHSITPTGSLGRNMKAFLMGQGSITPTGALGRAIKAFLVGQHSVTPVGVLSSVLKIFKTIGQHTVTPTGALGRKIAKAIGAHAVTPVGVLGRNIFKAVGSHAITPIGAAVGKFIKAVGKHAITPLGRINWTLKMSVGAHGITPGGVLSAHKKFIQWVGSHSVTPVGVVSTLVRWGKTVGQHTITPVGTLGRNISKSIGAHAITPVGILGRKIAISIGTHSVTPTGALSTIAKFVKAVGQGAITPVGTLGRLIKIAVGSGSITPIGELVRYFARKIALLILHRTYRDVNVEIKSYRDLTVEARGYRELELRMRG